MDNGTRRNPLAMIGRRGAEPDAEDSVTVEGPKNTDRYFKRLRLRLKLAFLTAFVLPLIALSAYFHLQFNSTLREAGKLHLAALAESQKNTVDLFLQERVVNIFHLFHDSAFNVSPSQEDMNRYFQNLQQSSEAFIDVGFCDSEGQQIGYAGPFPQLRGKDYSAEEWFVTVMSQESPYYISSIYPGLRNRLHFTTAVRQRVNGHRYIMRATLDPDKFYMFLRNMDRGKGVDSALINSDGLYQLVDPGVGKVFEKSVHMPSQREGSGVEEMAHLGESFLVAYAWLDEVPWALVVTQPLRIAYAEMYETRLLMIAGTTIVALVLALLVWNITDRLLLRAQSIADSREELQTQLLHASKLAALGELAAGIAHEVNNPLAVIGASCGVVRDYFDPELQLEWTPEDIRYELTNIDSAVFRASGITRKLLNFSRKEPPRLVPANVSDILDNAAGGLKEQEFHVANIELCRDYAAGLPMIAVDPDQLTQVFLNLINNAGDAIVGPGSITLSTRRDGDSVRVSVTDTGAGMTLQEMEKIFMPFYTSKEVGKGTGLGLSVSLSIVESMGGRIEVQSMPDKGSSFTVVLPIPGAEETVNESS